MARESLDLRYRLTTTAADKASVFTEFMAEAREEEEAAGRRRRRAGGGVRERCGFQLPLLEGKKMTRGNGTITAPTGIQVSGLKSMELSFCASWERIQTQFM